MSLPAAGTTTTRTTMAWFDLMARVCASFDNKNKSWSQEHCAMTGFQYLPTQADLADRLKIPKDVWIVRPNICADGFVFDQPRDYHTISSLLRNAQLPNQPIVPPFFPIFPNATPSQVQLVATMANQLVSNFTIVLCDELTMICWYSKNALHFKRPDWSGVGVKEEQTVDYLSIEFDVVRPQDLLWDSQNDTSNVPVHLLSIAKKFFTLVLELVENEAHQQPQQQQWNHLRRTESPPIDPYRGQPFADALQAKREQLFTHVVRHPFIFVLARLTLRFRNLQS